MFKSKLNKWRNAVVVASATGLALIPTVSHAALDGAVKTAVEAGFADTQEAAGLMVVGFAGLFGILLVVGLLRNKR
ncbi:hypothetical protein QG053_04755 [Kingella kingae]|uniref:hypothetical protein n=1 Tax=Kingella kingae TaxID=504 RepID=UPI00254FB84B|nr:hypothetical protein [Kingella kingae]MDK4529092.1 hypothetical protein [Kingella kingae]MDK4564363.1 hypothetical protein [Kingella kingae]MDK4579057.1 hypothetical protein [Kingella kingae]MDK4609458.1 hypothetical protein [Kingella kingae]MDK4627396.1 hypothetical protein [Kingella kingae]